VLVELCASARSILSKIGFQVNGAMVGAQGGDLSGGGLDSVIG